MKPKELRCPEYMAAGSQRASDQARERALLGQISKAKRIISALHRPLERQAQFASRLEAKYRGKSEAELVLEAIGPELKEWLE